MSEQPKIIWAYTEAHLRQWMEALHEDHQDSQSIRFPHPDSLSDEQLADFSRRISQTIENSDGALPAIHGFAWMILENMGIISQNRP